MSAFIRDQIAMKQGTRPYYGTATQQVVTDMDHFPYTRYFRGRYESSQPIVFDREAGWRPVNDACYKGSCDARPLPYPTHCFEAPCSTVYPCYPQYLQKFSDREALNVQLNRECIVQYR